MKFDTLLNTVFEDLGYNTTNSSQNTGSNPGDASAQNTQTNANTNTGSSTSTGQPTISVTHPDGSTTNISAEVLRQQINDPNVSYGNNGDMVNGILKKIENEQKSGQAAVQATTNGV
jgi:hypothetical protein